MMFAIPGLILGFLFAYSLNSVVGFILFDLAQLVVSYALHYTAIILGYPHFTNQKFNFRRIFAANFELLPDSTGPFENA
jgi:hypothetical protein